ncbi:MAG: CPBP family intramembrane metalloprotease [Lachnospiraceae bacterium]|nr:CPBP family intramembrane metalloprotease [Lachnospiraceae bacterium]
MSEMKTEMKRLWLYLCFSFMITWAWFLIANPKGTLWTEMPDERQSFLALGMLFPAISHILVRYLTKEGFAMTGEGSMMLGISFRNRKWIWFVLALFLPWIMNELGDAIRLLICPDLFDPEYYRTFDIEQKMLYLLPVNAMVCGTIGSVAAFGEEGGWRGYMMPKMIRIFGRTKAFIAGGIVWGLWHAPLTCIGHNFGTDYAGYPYVGILKMCLMCILFGILLTILTEKSGSVWPAAIMHAVVNMHPGILVGYVNPDKADGMRAAIAKEGGIIAMVIVAAVMLLLCREKRGKAGKS